MRLCPRSEQHAFFQFPISATWHPCVAFLPLGRALRKCPKPGPFPEGPQTLSDHLKAKRLADGLLLKEAARILGVSPFTLSNWERGKRSPRVLSYGRVVAFLGFDPNASSDELPAQMISYRRRHGLSQRAAAKLLGVDPTTWWGWEKGRRSPKGDFAERLVKLLRVPLREHGQLPVPGWIEPAGVAEDPLR